MGKEAYGKEFAEERYRLEIGYEALGSLERSLHHWMRASKLTVVAAAAVTVVMAVAVAAVSVILWQTF